MEIIDFKEKFRKKIAKEIGTDDEHAVYINHLVRSVVGKITDTPPQDVQGDNSTRELCQNDAEKMDYIIGSIQGVLLVIVPDSEFNEEEAFEQFPDVHSIYKYFYKKTT